MLGEITTTPAVPIHLSGKPRTSKTGATSWQIWPPGLRGNCARGMSLVALHNGGGVGIGKAINGGFGMVLDGSERVDEIPEVPSPDYRRVARSGLGT